MYPDIHRTRPDSLTRRNADLSDDVVEYFLGQGHHQKKFTHLTDEGIADASSTLGDRIGNRLSWNAVAEAAAHLKQELPSRYDMRK